jgi:hypothetical protein
MWVIDFAKKYFTSNSVFLNTDNHANWQSLGDFDYSNKNLGFCGGKQKDRNSRRCTYREVHENLFYFKSMCQSKYILCPAGDTEWSFRFYETLMCKSIPIVMNWHHTYRTAAESNIKYKYVLLKDVDKIGSIDYDEYVNENNRLFKQYHMLENNESL